MFGHKFMDAIMEFKMLEYDSVLRVLNVYFLTEKCSLLLPCFIREILIECVHLKMRQCKNQGNEDMNHTILENQKSYHGPADKCTCSAMSINSEEHKVTDFLSFAHPPGLVS